MGELKVYPSYLGVAQFGRAGCLERSSRRFKSCLSDHGNMVYRGRHVCLKNMRSQFNSVCSHLRVHLVDGCDGIGSSILPLGNGGSNPSTLKSQECSIVV